MQSELLTPSNERMLQGWKNRGNDEYVIMSTECDEVSLFEWGFLLPLFHTIQGHTQNTWWALGLPKFRLNLRY